MSNVQLAWDNAVADALQIYNDGYGIYNDTLPNLGKESLALKWVSSGATSSATRFTFGLTTTAGNPTIALMALCSHNLTLAATVRIRASTVSNFASLAYDSGTLNAFATGVTEASRKGMRWNYIHRLSTPTAAAYWRLDISDASNPAGYVSVGRLFAGQGLWQPSLNMLAGARLGWESNAESQKALNGAEWFVDAEAHRYVRFNTSTMPRDEMLASAFDLSRVAAGANREVVFQYDPADTVHSVRRSFMGRLRQLSALEEPQPLALSSAFEIKELL
jgi:hypothetical protein